jgi:hypothetical protein
MAKQSSAWAGLSYLLLLSGCDDLIGDSSGYTISIAPATPGIVVDRCEDGDSHNDVGGIWGTYADSYSRVWPSTEAFQMSGPGYRSTYAARMNGVTAHRPGSFAGMFVSMGTQATDIDLPSVKGFRFRMKGTMDTGSLLMKVPYVKDGRAVDYAYDIAAELESNWKLVEASFDNSNFGAWMELPEIPNPTSAPEFHFVYVNDSGGSIDIWIDNMELLF